MKIEANKIHILHTLPAEKFNQSNKIKLQSNKNEVIHFVFLEILKRTD